MSRPPAADPQAHTFPITLIRCAWETTTFEIDAKTLVEAKAKALAAASNPDTEWHLDDERSDIEVHEWSSPTSAIV